MNAHLPLFPPIIMKGTFQDDGLPKSCDRPLLSTVGKPVAFLGCLNRDTNCKAPHFKPRTGTLAPYEPLTFGRTETASASPGTAAGFGRGAAERGTSCREGFFWRFACIPH